MSYIKHIIHNVCYFKRMGMLLEMPKHFYTLLAPIHVELHDQLLVQGNRSLCANLELEGEGALLTKVSVSLCHCSSSIQAHISE